MFNSQLSSFPSNNRNLSGNSSERSNSDFELVSGGSQKISMESGSASPTEEVQPSPPNIVLNNFEQIQIQQQPMLVESNQNQPINQLLVKENEQLKKQLEGVQRELDQNRAIMAKILACQIEGKKKERQEAVLRNATARIVNLQQRDIWDESNYSNFSSSPPTPPIPPNVILQNGQLNHLQSNNSSHQQEQEEIPAFDMWREPDEDEEDPPTENEEHQNSHPPLNDIWREPEEEEEYVEEENMARNDIWAEPEEEEEGRNEAEILIDLNSAENTNDGIIDSNENTANPQIPFDILIDGFNNGNGQNNNIINEERQQLEGIIIDQQQGNDNASPDQDQQSIINSCDQYSIHSCDEYESALSGHSHQGTPIPPISSSLDSNLNYPAFPASHRSSSTSMSELANQMSNISGISSLALHGQNQFPPAHQIVENLLGDQRQNHFDPYFGIGQPEEVDQDEINRQNSLQFDEMAQEIVDIRAEMRNENENIGARISYLEDRFVDFQNAHALFDLNIRLDQIEERMDLLDNAEGERNHRIASNNLDFIGRLLNLEQKMRRIDESGLFRNAFLKEYANQIGVNNFNQELLIRAPFTYSDEFKQLIFSGTSLGFNGIIVLGTAKIRNYPADFLDSIIRNAINSQNSEMIRFFVINFPWDQKPQWPECLTRIEVENIIFDLPTISSAHPMHLLQIIKKRAIREDKVIYSFRNASLAKFVLEVYFDLSEDIYRKVRSFTIRSM